MKLDICIVEDSKMDAKILKLILETYLDERHIIYTIKTYDTGLAFFADYEEGYITPTTLFMDIFLPKSNGLEICRKMRHMGYSGDILITTETKDHAIDAFSVDARGYILKPYNAPDVLDVLERVCRYASIRTLTIKKQKRMIHIPLAEILYIESIAPNCTIHCLDNVIYTIRKKLDAIETEIISIPLIFQSVLQSRIPQKRLLVNIAVFVFSDEMLIVEPDLRYFHLRNRIFHSRT